MFELNRNEVSLKKRRKHPGARHVMINTLTQRKALFSINFKTFLCFLLKFLLVYKFYMLPNYASKVPFKWNLNFTHYQAAESF